MSKKPDINVLPFRTYLWLRLRLPLAVLLAVNLIGTLGYHLIEGWNWGDSFFMTVTTVFAVGYGEVHTLSGPGRFFTILLIVLGVGTIAFASFMLVRLLLEEELGNLLRGRKMLREIGNFSNHVVVCGFGRNGRQAVAALARNKVTVVVIDQNQEKVTGEPPEHIYFLHGDATEEGILKLSGVQSARGLITTLPKDADNVFVALTARELNPKLTIVTRANEEASVAKLRRAGAHDVTLSDSIAGRHMASVLLRPTVVEFVDTLTGAKSSSLQLEQFELKAGSSLVGKSLRSCSVREMTGASIVGLKQAAGMIVNPSVDTILNSGDTLIALGNSEQIQKLAQIL